MKSIAAYFFWQAAFCLIEVGQYLLIHAFYASSRKIGLRNVGVKQQGHASIGIGRGLVIVFGVSVNEV